MDDAVNSGEIPLPVNPEAERAVLSCMVKDPANCIPRAIDELKVDFFQVPAHRILFEAIIRLHQTKPTGQIDAMLLKGALPNDDLMDPGLFSDVPESARFEPNANVLKKTFIFRRLLAEGVTWLEASDQGPHDLLDKLETSIFKIQDEMVGEIEIKNMKAGVMDAIQSIEDCVSGCSGNRGLMTGFHDLDAMTNGLKGGEMMVVAARPSMGKTSFVMNMVENISIQNERAVPSAIFSLEMSSEMLIQRMLCSRATVNMSKIRGGFLSRHDFPKLMKAASELAEAPIWIDDSPVLSITELRARARRLKQQHDIGLIVIDYLQLIKGSGAIDPNDREKEVSEVSLGIKAMARELNLPVIVLAQLNRQPEHRYRGMPKMSDLRESGSIEEHADLVGLLMRPEYYAEYGEDEWNDGLGEAIFIIAKQRNGPTGEVPLAFNKEFMRFRSRAFQDE